MINRDHLKDHLRPSPTCVKSEKPEEGPGAVQKMQDVPVNKSVHVNLADCLACSGCITSAETVLVAQHTTSLFLDLLNNRNGRKVVVTVSPQARASIAHRLGLKRADGLISHFLKQRLGVDKVLDSSFGRGIALLRLWDEFKRACLVDGGMLLTSACPGWVCFVEKTQPWLIKHASITRSPQHIMGAHVRRADATAIHVTVMPCYDKKLEASRSDFDGEIDCVLTSAELFGLLKDEKVPPDSADVDLFDNGVYINGELAGNPGSGSGGYLDYVMHRLVLDFGAKLEQCKASRDVSEFNALLPDGRQCKLAAIYGFSNIQNLVRKAKSGADGLPYAFVEVMACPGGCLNGGGQVLPDAPTSPLQRRQFLDGLADIYNASPAVWPEDCAEIAGAYAELSSSGQDQLLTTGYRAVEDDLHKSAFQVTW